MSATQPHHTLSPMQRAIVGTTIALIAISIIVRLVLLPMVSHGRDLYFTTFASSPFPGL